MGSIARFEFSTADLPVERIFPLPELHPNWHDWFKDSTENVLCVQNREYAAAIAEMNADDLGPATMCLLHRFR